MINRIYLTVHEFARLHHVNKRTLHYYDSIGLFSPQKVGENKYRYYTYAQSGEFEIILALRELGMSIEEIRTYRKNSSPDALSQLLLEKNREIQEKIDHLRSIQGVLMEKRAGLLLARSDQIETIDVVDCPPETLLLIDVSRMSSEKDLDEGLFAPLSTFWEDERAGRAVHSSYGSVLPLDRLLAEEYDACQYLFVRIPDPGGREGLSEKPGGPYLRAFCKGGWSGLPAVCRRMRDYAADHGLRLTGPAYEEGINELGITSREELDQYVTQITIPCAPEAEGRS